MGSVCSPVGISCSQKRRRWANFLSATEVFKAYSIKKPKKKLTVVGGGHLCVFHQTLINNFSSVVKPSKSLVIGLGSLVSVHQRVIKQKKPKKVLATDTSVSTTMKNAAKRDMYCELQNSVNHQMFERSMQLWVSPVVLPP